MKSDALWVASSFLLSAACVAADRSITVPPKVATSWGFLTNSTAVKQSRTMATSSTISKPPQARTLNVRSLSSLPVRRTCSSCTLTLMRADE